MNKAFYFFLVVLFVTMFVVAASEPEPRYKSSEWNQAIKDRNQGSERETRADKITVKSILKEGCVPIVPENQNKNITKVCPTF